MTVKNCTGNFAMRKSLRKHITKAKLEELAKLHLKGVPITRLIRDNNLDVSAPHLNKLIRAYFAADKLVMNKQTKIEADAIINSLFPPWLDCNGEVIQIQPSNWKYEGYFPFGKWAVR